MLMNVNSPMSHRLYSACELQVAEDGTLAAEERQACIGRIKVAGRELLDLIESTLEIGKIEIGREGPTFESVSLHRHTPPR